MRIYESKMTFKYFVFSLLSTALLNLASHDLLASTLNKADLRPAQAEALAPQYSKLLEDTLIFEDLEKKAAYVHLELALMKFSDRIVAHIQGSDFHVSDESRWPSFQDLRQKTSSPSMNERAYLESTAEINSLSMDIFGRFARRLFISKPNRNNAFDSLSQIESTFESSFISSTRDQVYKILSSNKIDQMIIQNLKDELITQTSKLNPSELDFLVSSKIASLRESNQLVKSVEQLSFFIRENEAKFDTESWVELSQKSSKLCVNESWYSDVQIFKVALLSKILS